MTEESFQDFIAEATDYLKARGAQAQEQFGIGGYERYDIDLFAGGFGGQTLV